MALTAAPGGDNGRMDDGVRDYIDAARHPGLWTSKGTIKLRPNDAAGIPDDRFRHLVRAALDG